jgi:prepilin-type N-terminal cleavage/methylation domain-containing protein
MIPQSVRRGRRQGFTLIEVMFGVVLAGMAVSMVATLIPLATKGQNASREYLQMTDVAQSKLDRLKDLGYGRLDEDEIVDAGIGTKESEDTYRFVLVRGVDSATSATGRITISDFDPDIKRVVISIDWKSAGATATPRAYELQGLIARQ